MFPVKKAEENKFILTAPTEFTFPKFVLRVLCSPHVWHMDSSVLDGRAVFEAQCRRGAGSGCFLLLFPQHPLTVLPPLCF